MAASQRPCSVRVLKNTSVRINEMSSLQLPAPAWFLSHRRNSVIAAAANAAVAGALLGQIYSLCCGFFLVNFFKLPSELFSTRFISNFALLLISLLPLNYFYSSVAQGNGLVNSVLTIL